MCIHARVVSGTKAGKEKSSLPGAQACRLLLQRAWPLDVKRCLLLAGTLPCKPSNPAGGSHRLTSVGTCQELSRHTRNQHTSLHTMLTTGAWLAVRAGLGRAERAAAAGAAPFRPWPGRPDWCCPGVPPAAVFSGGRGGSPLDEACGCDCSPAALAPASAPRPSVPAKDPGRAPPPMPAPALSGCAAPVSVGPPPGWELIGGRPIGGRPRGGCECAGGPWAVRPAYPG
eukprot:scaffold241369_cov17-Tisochrysis_lutea.AAC.2